MKWWVDAKPSYSILKVRLEPGEKVHAEPGAMVYMSSGIEVETKARGGLFKSLLRAMFTGESFFINTFHARTSGEVWFAPPTPGDIHYVKLGGERGLIVQDTSYLAHHGDIDLTITWRGFRGLLAEGSLVWLKLKGVGGAWLTSYGAIEQVKLGPGERIIVDNFHFVAMDEGMDWRARKFGGLKSFIFGGEGIVIEITGPGKVYLQTRALPALADALVRFIGRRK